MELKPSQKRVVEEVERYLRALAEGQEKGNRRHAAKDAWEMLGLGRYDERRNGLNEDLPTFCVKVPTGGGKTLIATQVLGSIYRSILHDRNGAGLVLWVVPSSQIYRDTLRRLRDRNDMYRMMLEHAVSRRLELWEKHELARLSPARLRDCLNILVVQLASTNRVTKEQLKFFRDSGGAIVDHFPPENDLDAHQTLKARIPNLDVIEGTDLVKTSVGNLVRLCRPPVILDEGHKAYSTNARETIEGFNASVVVELSATPPQSANIASRVSGRELLDEEMIKLPINVATSGHQNWKDVLTKARDKRVALARAAEAWAGTRGRGRLIRPIVLVQVERTGNDQQEKGFVHANEVAEYLAQKLSIAREAIKIKSAENDGLEDIDLLEEGCQVEWIITKSALQEGWDCPFAYILVSLNATGSGTAMTQLVGRVLRQPFQSRIPDFPQLNESYVFCLKQRAGEAAKLVKKALENEGYEGEIESLVRSGERETQPNLFDIPIRTDFARLYGRPFQGKIYLPKFCLRERDLIRPLDYFKDLVARVNVSDFDFAAIGQHGWQLTEALRQAKDRFQKVTIESAAETVAETDADLIEKDEQVLGWLVASLRYEFLSHKQLRTITDRIYRELINSHLDGMVRGKLALVKFAIRQKTESFIQEQLDHATERAFGELFDARRIFFYLESNECAFQIPDFIRIEATGIVRRFTRENGELTKRTLFEYEPDHQVNEYERQIALVLDESANVLWWFRNRVGKGQFVVQGYRNQRIYPDFVAQGKVNGRACHRVLVVESKGEHLSGSADTVYKRNVAKYFEQAGRRVTWQQLGADFKDHIFRFQVLDESQPHGREWKDELNRLLGESA
ncbi:MAG: DEAD/DEAH box helicase family protein [Phycisphaerales bacterium]|nr:DEAD/DEAH box helicase family protein [Phycisphaerales bacterium]